MRQIVKRLRTRSFDRVFFRLYTIAKRYGLSRNRYLSALGEFISFAKSRGAVPTFPVTAALLKKHGKIISSLQDLGAEFAVHGYRHIDYSLLSEDEFSMHLAKAHDLFSEYGIAYSGFRFPYLRKNSSNLKVLEHAGFSWDSSEVVSWPIQDKSLFSAVQWRNYETILATYDAADASGETSLPYMRGNLVEIPVSVPDDDILIERLELSDGNSIKNIWQDMSTRAAAAGECLVLQLHPERFFHFAEPLAGVLQKEMDRNNVWMPSLDELADWWRKRNDVTPHVRENSGSGYTVSLPGDSQARITWAGTAEALSRVSAAGSNTFEVTSPYRPLAGVAERADDYIMRALRDHGYLYEVSSQKELYPVYVDAAYAGTKEALMQEFSLCSYPVAQVARWPGGAKSCLVMSGDIDCISIIDFFDRMFG